MRRRTRRRRRILKTWQLGLLGRPHYVGNLVHTSPANIITCWKLEPILCLRPRLSRKDRG